MVDASSVKTSGCVEQGAANLCPILCSVRWDAGETITAVTQKP
jgi:hypothetical protein